MKLGQSLQQAGADPDVLHAIHEIAGTLAQVVAAVVHTATQDQQPPRGPQSLMHASAGLNTDMRGANTSGGLGGGALMTGAPATQSIP